GAKGLADVAVVLAALVGIADQQADRRAGGAAFVDAGEDLRRIGLVALRHVPRGAGTTAVEFGLDVGLGQRHPGREAVDDPADRRPVALVEVGDAKEVTEGAAGHGARIVGVGVGWASAHASRALDENAWAEAHPTRAPRGSRQFGADV